MIWPACSAPRPHEGKRADDQGHRERRARLAEAVASVHEIEAIVRGTEPASSNLTAELLRVREQFTDLPLVMNIDDINDDLPPEAAYGIPGSGPLGAPERSPACACDRSGRVRLARRGFLGGQRL